MDALTRWSIAIGSGAMVGMVLLLGHHITTSEARAESADHAFRQVFPDFTHLDASVEFTTYDIPEMSRFADLLVEADLDHYIDCGGYGNPAHVCVVDADIPKALSLVQAYTPSMQEGAALTVGEYTTPYRDVLSAAHTIRTDVGLGAQNVTSEGNTFTVSYLKRGSVHPDSQPWQYAVAAVPSWLAWLTAGAVGVIGAVLTAAMFRQRPEEPVEEIGVEYFDELLEPA